MALELADRWPDWPGYRSLAAGSARNLAQKLFAMGNITEAEALLDGAAPILEQFAQYNPDPIRGPYEWSLAQALRARFVIEQNPTEACRLLEEAAEAMRQLANKSPHIDTFSANLAEIDLLLVNALANDVTMDSLSREERAQHAIDEAVSLYRELLRRNGVDFVSLQLRKFATSPILQEYPEFCRFQAELETYGPSKGK